jgi:hypothetical protein
MVDTHKVVNTILDSTKRATQDRWSRNNENDNLHCGFCDGSLGREQPITWNDSPGWTKYRSCLNCGHQWAEHYWPSLKRRWAEKQKK